MRKILAIMLMALASVLFVGCGSIPDGYEKGHGPFGGEPFAFLLIHQFEDFNPDGISDTQEVRIMYFEYNGDLFNITTSGTRFLGSHFGGTNVTVNGSNNEKLGTLVNISEEKNKRISLISYFAFLDGDYLYYDVVSTKIKKLFITADGFFVDSIYQKCDYHRFDLRSCNNEKIDLQLFWEKLSVLDNRPLTNKLK